MVALTEGIAGFVKAAKAFPVCKRSQCVKVADEGGQRRRWAVVLGTGQQVVPPLPRPPLGTPHPGGREDRSQWSSDTGISGGGGFKRAYKFFTRTVIRSKSTIRELSVHEVSLLELKL